MKAAKKMAAAMNNGIARANIGAVNIGNGVAARRGTAWRRHHGGGGIGGIA